MLEFTSTIETAIDGDEKHNMPPAKKLARYAESDSGTEEDSCPSLSPKCKKPVEANFQKLIQPASTASIINKSQNTSVSSPIQSAAPSSPDGSYSPSPPPCLNVATVIAALGSQFAGKKIILMRYLFRYSSNSVSDANTIF